MLSTKNKARFLSVLILLAMVFSSANFSPAHAAGVIVVNSDTDTVADDGLCTLREALTAANSDTASGASAGECAAGAGADSITFAANYTITLDGSQLPAVTSEMTIIGNGAANTIIQANLAPNTATYRVFEVTSTGNLTLDRVTVRHGNLVNGCNSRGCPVTLEFSGGGILNFGTLSVTDSTLSDNRSAGLFSVGGGIYNGGTLSVTDSTISGNTSTYNGGGIYNGGGTVTITNSIFSGNSGDGIANGGGTVTITNSTFSGNFGAGIRNNGGTMNVTGSTLSGNTASYGGGIYNGGGTLSVTNSTISGNSGGGIYNSVYGGTMNVTNSTISDNNGWFGGGITNGGVLTVTDSILSGNSSNSDGGGIYNAGYGTLNVTNSTLSGNSSNSDGGDGGGAIYNGPNLTTTVTNSTISGNTAGPQSDLGGGGILNVNGTVTVTRSLVSGNSANAGDEIYSWAPIASTSNVFGHSGQSNADAFYDFTPGASDFNATTDGTPTTLASILDTTLADNGGPTQTHALVAGSPAIDFAGACGLATDQRGVARPQGAACDAGAFEWVSPNQPPTAVAGGPYLVAVNASIAFDGSASSDPDGDTLTETWTAAGGSAAGSTYTAGSEAGIFDVCLTVNDGTVDSESNCTIVVVYDPSAGFVTGGGWIDSPAGAYKDDEALSGKATFGFVAKYKKGANVPDGNTSFAFDLAGLAFYSDSYEWLVVNQAGTNAQFRGSGTVNGALDLNGNPYKFMLWAGDGPDTFRIKIWSEDANGIETVVYDNGFEGSGYETGQPIGAGNIVVHKGK